jgi:hypothetical protein
MIDEHKALLERIRRYADEWDMAALDEIAATYTGVAMDYDVRSALIDAYGYHYGQLAMDYAAGKYWSGGRAAHLEDLLDRLTRLISLSGDPSDVIQKSQCLREQATLETDERERQRLFVEAYALLDELLDGLDASDPMTTQCRAEMVEALAESAMFQSDRSDRNQPLDHAADILERLLAELDEDTFETVGAAMMYVRRLPEFPAHRRLADLTAAFDRWAESNWARSPILLVSWSSLYLILLHHRTDGPLFDHWYVRAARIPRVATGTEERLSNLSHDILSLAADLVRRGSLEAGEKCYVLSLDLETLLYHANADTGMAWRKLHFAGFLIAFYREHKRTTEAVAVLREHLRFGREALRRFGSESSLHGHMSDLLQAGLELFDERETTETYREITEHLEKRIAALKEQFSDHTVVAGKKVWQYLYYVHDDDYENLVHYHLMLGNRAEAINVLREWASLDTRKREQLNHSTVDWAQLAAKEEFVEIRRELRECAGGGSR